MLCCVLPVACCELCAFSSFLIHLNFQKALWFIMTTPTFPQRLGVEKMGKLLSEAAGISKLTTRLGLTCVLIGCGYLPFIPVVVDGGIRKVKMKT